MLRLEWFDCVLVCVCVRVRQCVFKVFSSVQINIKPMCCFTAALPLKILHLVLLIWLLKRISTPPPHKTKFVTQVDRVWVNWGLWGGIYHCLSV